jgi:hypothetical protein
MRRSGPRWRELIGGAVIVVVLAAGGLVVWYRATYNVLPGQGASGRVHWCGRNYEWSGGTSSWARLTAQAGGTVRLAGRYPPLGSRAALYATAVRRPAGGASCTTGVYLQTGPDRYRVYSLEGGP